MTSRDETSKYPPRPAEQQPAVLALQRGRGNWAVARLLGRSPAETAPVKAPGPSDKR